MKVEQSFNDRDTSMELQYILENGVDCFRVKYFKQSDSRFVTNIIIKDVSRNQLLELSEKLKKLALS